MKKVKILALMLIVVAMILVIPVATFAEETATVEPDAEIGGAIDDAVTLYDRLIEFYTNNKTEIITTVGEGISLIVLAVVATLWNKITKQNTLDLGTIKAHTIDASQKQDKTVTAYNEMVESFNTLNQSYINMQAVLERLTERDQELHDVLTKIKCEGATILDILDTVYVNSSIPQGLKDLVTLKYCKCLKEIDPPVENEVQANDKI
jgi:hypothetical protein